MKRELALTGVALLISVLLSSPTFAQTSLQTPNAKPAPAPIVETHAPQMEELSLDEAIMTAQTPEDRARLLMRCAGPPPKLALLSLAAPEPASEPAVIADAPSH